jgi:arginine deiminase
VRLRVQFHLGIFTETIHLTCNMKIKVSSETGVLESVIVHTPGREVSLVSPDVKNKLLFDDIIYEADAKIEHEDMLAIFEIVVGRSDGVIQITRLIREVFEHENARMYFVSLLMQELEAENLRAIEKRLLKLDAEQLLEFAVMGQTDGMPDFILLPSPNLLFTRDLAAVINDGVILSRAAKKARIRESLLMDTIVEFHPLFGSVKSKVFRMQGYESIEGGDILIPDDKLVLIGMSERTSFSGIMKAAGAILDWGVENVLIVDIPKQRSSMHLDTIFTFASDNECIVFPPSITDRKDNVVCLSRNGNGQFQTRLMPSLKSSLEELLGHSFDFIKCGGDDPNSQLREQWTDGANVFALAPGVIVGYERNVHTFDALAKHGYDIMTQFDFINNHKQTSFTADPDHKIAISFIGNELCRGRGGARCMTQPIARK